MNFLGRNLHFASVEFPFLECRILEGLLYIHEYRAMIRAKLRPSYNMDNDVKVFQTGFNFRTNQVINFLPNVNI